MSIPSQFLCPITHEIMKDPVSDPEGNSYERIAIIKWLKQSATSPLTRTRLTIKKLKYNRKLREEIKIYKQDIKIRKMIKRAIRQERIHTEQLIQQAIQSEIDNIFNTLFYIRNKNEELIQQAVQTAFDNQQVQERNKRKRTTECVQKAEKRIKFSEKPLYSKLQKIIQTHIRRVVPF